MNTGALPLVAPHLPVRGAEPASDLPDHYLDLYKLAVEMADRISARRAVANSFFLTISTGLAGVLGTAMLQWYVAVAGIVFAATWWALLKSYRELNRAKFQVIVAMEERLPVKVFGDEWASLKANPTRYRELGRLERIVPWVFAALYGAELVRQLVT
jgi:hypothetical protein